MNCNSARALMLALAVSAMAVACSSESETTLIASAQALLAKNDAKGAIIQLKSALQKNPESAQARLLLGKTLLEQGNPVAALVELRKAQELRAPDEQVVPELARAMLLVGEASKVVTQYANTRLNAPIAAADLKTSVATALAAQNDRDGAQSAIDEALRLQPGYAPAVIVQARLAAADNKLDDALRLLDEVLAKDAANERAGLFKAEILWRGKNDPDAAAEAYRKVIAARPGSLPAMSALASLLLQQNKVAEAKTQFEQLKKRAPAGDPETLFLEARLAMIDGNFKGAREITERILKVLPDNVRTLELAGAAEFRLKNYLQAESLLGQALKRAPGLVMSRQLLAQTYLRTGQPEKAVQALKPMLESGRVDGATLALAGEAYLQAGDPKRSEAAFSAALKAAPTDARVRTSAAMAQLARGGGGEAINELEAIAKSDSGPRADLAVISARLSQKDLPGALKAIDALEKKMPDQALPLNLRGRVLLLKNDIPGATKNFEAALAKDPAYFASVASLAAIELSRNEPDAARKRFEDYLKAHPKSYQAKLALAELEARTGAPVAKVTGLVREASKLNPSEPTPHLLLINRLLTTGDGKGALTAAQEATAALPDNLEIMELLGRAQVAAGDSQNAISTFKKLASLQPRKPQHEVNLAGAYMETGDKDAAAAALRRALELQPNLVSAQRGLAQLAMMNKQPQEAMSIARKMQQADPKDPTGLSFEGDIEAARGNWDAAATAYRAALQLGKTSDTAVRLHRALLGAKKQADADRLAAEWQKEHPRDAVFRFYLGDMALARNDLPAAEGYYRAVIDIQPNNALALNNVAWMMVKQGKPGALPLAEKAASLMVESAPLLDTLASALEADGQVPKAIETQKRAIEIDPKDPALTLRLAKLYVKQGDKPRARAELESLAKLGDKFAAQAEVAALLKTL